MDDTDLLYHILHVPADLVDPADLCAVLCWTSGEKEIC